MFCWSTVPLTDVSLIQVRVMKEAFFGKHFTAAADRWALMFTWQFIGGRLWLVPTQQLLLQHTELLLTELKLLHVSVALFSLQCITH